MINENKYTDYVTQIIECLKTEKTRKSALELLLGLAESEELIPVFISLDIPKVLIRLIENEDLDERPLALQILINFTSDERYLDAFIALNAFNRITKLLLDKIPCFPGETSTIPTDFLLNQSNPNQSASELKLVLDKYILNADTVNTQIKSKDIETSINLYFILLANLTSFDLGQRAFLEVNNEQRKGVILFKLLDKFFENIYSPCFDFCSSVIANISSLKEGRELILSNKIFKIFLIQFDKMNNMKMVNVLRMIRNCCFEYEKYHEELLVREGIVLAFLIKMMLLSNVEKSLLQKIGVDGYDAIYFPNFNAEVMTEEDKSVVSDLIIDVLLVLSNNEKAVELMKAKGVAKAIALVEGKLSDKETVKERILVIKNILEGIK